MTLHLSEADVDRLLTPADAVTAIERCFERLARDAIDNRPRQRLTFGDSELAVLAAADVELGLAASKSYVGTRSVVLLFDDEQLVAVIDAARLGQLRTGAASAVAVKQLARTGATTLGVIGCGRQARAHVDCIRAAAPAVERVVAYCPTREHLETFCADTTAEPAESQREAAAQDVVVIATTSRDPVVRGEWLAPGALVCAVGANNGSDRELDNVVIERAAFVCCDSVAVAQRESADLSEPVDAGVLDWLEVYELEDVVAGEVPGRTSDDDIVVFKSNGLAAWDLAAAAALVANAR